MTTSINNEPRPCIKCGVEISQIETWGDDLIVETWEQKVFVKVGTAWSNNHRKEEARLGIRNVLVIHQCED